MSTVVKVSNELTNLLQINGLWWTRLMSSRESSPSPTSSWYSYKLGCNTHTHTEEYIYKIELDIVVVTHFFTHDLNFSPYWGLPSLLLLSWYLLYCIVLYGAALYETLLMIMWWWCRLTCLLSPHSFRCRAGWWLSCRSGCALSYPSYQIKCWKNLEKNFLFRSVYLGQDTGRVYHDLELLVTEHKTQ